METHGHLDLLLQKEGILTGRDADPDGDFYRTNFEQAQKIAEEWLQDHKLFIQPTVSTQNFLLNKELWDDVEKVKLLIGTHPEIVKNDTDVEGYINHQSQVLGGIEKELLGTKIIGFGECGLDYYYSQDPIIKKKQQELFADQLQKAIDRNLPMVIHCRDAFDDLFAMLDEYSDIHGKFEIHCFTGDIETAKKVIDRGGLCGIGGIATFKSAQYLRDAVEYMPLENILLETDLPFLAPVPHRGKTCLPCMVDNVADTIAELKNISKDRLWETVDANTGNFYSI